MKLKENTRISCGALIAVILGAALVYSQCKDTNNQVRKIVVSNAVDDDAHDEFDADVEDDFGADADVFVAEPEPIVLPAKVDVRVDKESFEPAIEGKGFVVDQSDNITLSEGPDGKLTKGATDQLEEMGKLRVDHEVVPKRYRPGKPEKITYDGDGFSGANCGAELFSKLIFDEVNGDVKPIFAIVIPSGEKWPFKGLTSDEFCEKYEKIAKLDHRRYASDSEFAKSYENADFLEKDQILTTYLQNYLGLLKELFGTGYPQYTSIIDKFLNFTPYTRSSWNEMRDAFTDIFVKLSDKLGLDYDAISLVMSYLEKAELLIPED